MLPELTVRSAQHLRGGLDDTSGHQVVVQQRDLTAGIRDDTTTHCKRANLASCACILSPNKSVGAHNVNTRQRGTQVALVIVCCQLRDD